MAAILSENELDLLENYLFSDCVEDTAFDYNGCHGVLTAAIIAPENITLENCIKIIIDGDPKYNTEFEKDAVVKLFSKLHQGLSTQIANEVTPQLPCQLKYGDEGLMNWCAGFLEVYYANEDAWHSNTEATGEDVIAGLLLPFLLCSHIIEDDEELLEIANNKSLSQEMAEQIPELITDIYLHFKAPAEK